LRTITREGIHRSISASALALGGDSVDADQSRVCQLSCDVLLLLAPAWLSSPRLAFFRGSKADQGFSGGTHPSLVPFPWLSLQYISRAGIATGDETSEALDLLEEPLADLVEAV